MSNPAKDIRKQIKNVIQAELEGILSNELYQTLEKRLMDHLSARLNAIDERQKQLQSYMIRHTAPAVDKK